MKLTYLFLIQLYFFLLGGCSNAYAGAYQQKKHYSAAKNIEKAQQVKSENTIQNNTVIKNASSSKEDDYVIDVEDEDESTVFASKYVLIAKYFLILSSYTFILSDFYSSFKDRLPVYRHLSYTSSYKYIIQRSLRI